MNSVPGCCLHYLCALVCSAFEDFHKVENVQRSEFVIDKRYRNSIFIIKQFFKEATG